MHIFGAWKVNSLTVLFPLLLSLAAFVLAMIALFAGTGSQQQQLEEYHIIAINMSYFGKDLLPTSTSSASAQPTETNSGGIGGFFDDLGDDLGDAADDIEGEITDQLNDIIGDAADKLAETLGISQWYSFHIMNTCEGDFAPNTTISGAWYNTTNCTAREPGVNLNLTAMLDKEIDLGPLNLNAADLKLPDKVQDAIDLLNGCLLAVFVFYVLGSAFSGLGFLLAIATLALAWRKPLGSQKLLILANAANAFLGALTLMVGSALTTAVSHKGTAEINDAGGDVGISAIAGHKFLVISWVAFGLMGASLLFWTTACCFPRKNQFDQGRSAYQEKTSRPSVESDRRGLMRGLFTRRR